MDIQAYIESGIIESYVLGLANEDEIAELEKLRIQYISVESALTSFSKDLEKVTLAEAVTPPPHIKEQLFARLKDEKVAPVIPFDSRDKALDFNLGGARHETSIRPWKLMAAASIILLVVSASLNFYYYSRYNEKNEAYQSLLTERNSLFSANKIYQTNQHEWDHTADMIKDPDMILVKMKTPAGKKNMDATVFWDSRKKDVYILASVLPQPQQGRQFQLWAMVDGKPVDAGVIDMNCGSVCKLKNIPRAQAFAITLEKAGGSPVPDLSQLYVIGNI